eukprot:15469084-Alexandrium_andersonii.AAC.1
MVSTKLAGLHAGGAFWGGPGHPVPDVKAGALVERAYFDTKSQVGAASPGGYRPPDPPTGASN